LTEENVADLKIDLMRRLLAKNVDRNKIRRLFDFISQYVRFEKPEIAATFERKFDDIINLEQNMGITEILIRQAEDRIKQAEKALSEGLSKAKLQVDFQVEQAHLKVEQALFQVEQAQLQVDQARLEAEQAHLEAQLQAELQVELQSRLQGQLAEETAREERKNTVSNMRRHNFSAERIADITGYQVDEVKTFFKELDSRK
jgi:hypothetical protein